MATGDFESSASEGENLRPGFDPDHEPVTLSVLDIVQQEPLPTPDIKLTLPKGELGERVILSIYANWGVGILSDDETMVNAQMYIPVPSDPKEIYVQVFAGDPGQTLSRCQANEVIEDIVDLVEFACPVKFYGPSRFDDVRAIQTEEGLVYQVI